MGASILAKEYRCEAPGIPATELVWRETAKMGPSSTSCTVSRWADLRETKLHIFERTVV